MEEGEEEKQGRVLTKNILSAVQSLRITVVYVCSLIFLGACHASSGPRGEKGPLKQADS